MATEILKSFSVLQEELEKAKDNLKGVDEHIKKLIGRDPNDAGQQRSGLKRPVNQAEEPRGRGRGNGFTAPALRGPWDPRGRQEGDGQPTIKRRPGDTRTVFSRLSGPPRPSRDVDSGDEGELPHKPLVSSRVYATPKELPSRQEAMAAQSKDERSKARNRRMFGALLGTLHKFRQEETQMKVKEEKRAIVEKKLEENAKREKEELKRERVGLFLDRKQKQAEIKKIELKMLRIKEQDEWEIKNRNLLNFIQTRAKPHIFFLPKVHNMKTEERLVASQKIVAKMIEKKREDVQIELAAIEKRGRWRQGIKDQGRGNHPIASDDEHQEGGDGAMRGTVDKENRLESVLGVSKIENTDEVPETGKDGSRVKMEEDEEELDLESSGIILGEVDEIEGGDVSMIEAVIDSKPEKQEKDEVATEVDVERDLETEKKEEVIESA